MGHQNKEKAVVLEGSGTLFIPIMPVQFIPKAKVFLRYVSTNFTVSQDFVTVSQDFSH